jgi:nucleotide-binding universal stress UspA family protein
MIRSVLVPLDGSKTAEHALPFAARIARGAGAEVQLVHIATVAGWERPRGEQENLVEQLDAIAKPLRDDRLQVTTAIVNGYYSDIGQIVARLATERGVSLVAMTTHGRGGVQRFVYGSVADAVIRASHVPLLLIPASGAYPLPTDRPPRITVALDGSELSELALPAAVDLAKALEGQIELVHVVEPPNYGLELGKPATFRMDPAEALDKAEAYLRQVASELGQTGLAVGRRVIAGFAEPSVASLAQPKYSDILALGTHGHGGLRRVLLGSTATAALKRASVPLLVVRPDDA